MIRVLVVEIISPPTGMDHQRFEFHYHYFKAKILNSKMTSLAISSWGMSQAMPDRILNQCRL